MNVTPKDKVHIKIIEGTLLVKLQWKTNTRFLADAQFVGERYRDGWRVKENIKNNFTINVFKLKRWRSWLKALRHKTEGSGFDSRYVPWKFSSVLILLSVFSSPGVHAASDRNEYQKISLGDKVRPALGADSSVVLVGQTVKVKMEAQNFIPLLSLYGLLRARFFMLIRLCIYIYIYIYTHTPPTLS